MFSKLCEDMIMHTVSDQGGIKGRSPESEQANDVGPENHQQGGVVAADAAPPVMVQKSPSVALSGLIDTQLTHTQLPDTQLPDTQLPDTQLPDTQLTNTEAAGAVKATSSNGSVPGTTTRPTLENSLSGSEPKVVIRGVAPSDVPSNALSNTSSNASSNTPSNASSPANTGPSMLNTSEVDALILRATQGDAAAQTLLARRYFKGDGVEEDREQAVIWYKKAAEQGYAAAQYGLGKSYLWGYGVEKDDAEGFDWYKKAAEQGHAAAQHSLGQCYLCGWGVWEDIERGVYWCKKAAEQGDIVAQKELGMIYFNGEKVKEDLKQAAYWFEKAAKQDDAEAQVLLAESYQEGTGVEQDLKQAAYWFEKAAKQDNQFAQKELGIMYANGDGVEQNFEQAAYWLLRSGLRVEDDKKSITLGGPWVEGIVKSIPDVLKNTPEFNGIGCLILDDFRFDQAGFALIDQLIRFYPNIKSLFIEGDYDDDDDDDYEYDQFHLMIGQLVTTLREENTWLTDLEFDLQIDDIDDALQTQLDQLLEQNKVIGELRRYVLEHPAKTSDELPLDVLSQVVDKLIVHRIRRGDGKAETQAAVDEFLMGAQFNLLQAGAAQPKTD